MQVAVDRFAIKVIAFIGYAVGAVFPDLIAQGIKDSFGQSVIITDTSFYPHLTKEEREGLLFKLALQAHQVDLYDGGANADFVVGKNLSEKLSKKFDTGDEEKKNVILMSFMFHELGHNILEIIGVPYSTLHTQSLHEYFADLFAFYYLLATTDTDKEDYISDYLFALNINTIIEEVENTGGVVSEEHDAARVKINEIIKAAKDEGIPLNWNQLLDITLESIKGYKEKNKLWENFDTFGGVQTPSFRAGKDYAALSINPEQTTVFRPWCRRIDFPQFVKEAYAEYKKNIAREKTDSRGTTDKKEMPFISPESADDKTETIPIIPAEDLQKLTPILGMFLLRHLRRKDNNEGKIISSDDTDFGLCLTPDSLITLANGSQKPLIELKPFADLSGRRGVVGDGDMVLSLNEATGRLEPHRVLALLDMGVKPVYRITTVSGKTLKTTLTHPYRTPDGWKKLKNIKVGDEITVMKEAINYQPSTINSGAGEEVARNLGEFFQFLNSSLNNSGGNEEITFSLEKKQGLFGPFEREPSLLKGISNNSYCAMDLQFQSLHSGAGSQVIRKNYRFIEPRSKIEDIFFSFLEPEFSYYPFNFGDKPFWGRDYFKIFPEANLLRKAVVTKANFRDDAYRGIERWEFMQEGYFFNLLKMDKWSGVNDDFLHPLLPIVYLSEPPYPDAQPVLPYQGLPTGLSYVGKSAFLGIGTIWNPATFSLIQSLQPQRLLPQGFYAGNAQFLSVVQLLKLAFKSSLSYFKNNINYFFCQGLIPDAYASSFDLVKQHNSQDIFWEKIVSIEPLGPMQVYDIEVEGTHNFIAQGIVAHNTYTEKPETSNQKLEGKKMAGSPQEDKKGGIDLNPQNLDLEVQQKESSSPIISTPVNIDLQNFQGFTFQILSIQQVKYWEAVLG